MVNKQIKKISIFIMLVMILCVTISFPVRYVLAEETENEYEEKTYSNVTIEDDFDDSCVLVVMDKSVGGINKVHNEDFFGDIDIESIEDLTYMESNPNELKYLDQENFRQILKINLAVPSKENVLYAISVLEGIEGIKHAEPNYYSQPMEEDEYYDTVSENDFWNYFGENGIHLEEAWQFTTGSSDVKVGIIDSGIYNHPDLTNNLVAGWDFYNSNETTNDDLYGHGTFIAGIIGANSTNGLNGICKNVQLVPMQVTKFEGAWRFDYGAVFRAINYAINNNIPILNYSAGSKYTSSYTESYKSFQQALNGYSGLFVVASGNETLNIDRVRYFPAEFSNAEKELYLNLSQKVITVGALNENGARRENSNYGQNTVSIYAPGENIISTNSDAVQNNYRKFGGTSYAAPHVAGVAALMLSLNPNLTAQELKAKIIASADDITISTSYGNQEVKKLNAYEALKSVVYEISSNGTITDVNVPEKVDILGIPEEVNGITATGIGNNAFAGCNRLVEVIIPDSVTSIGIQAFYGCSNLSEVTFGENSQLESINLRAFSGTAISQIIIPQGVETIGSEAFWYCNNLEKIIITRPISNGAIFFDWGGGSYDVDDVCPSLTSIVVPDQESLIQYKSSFMTTPDLVGLVTDVDFEFTLLSDGTYAVSKGYFPISGELIIPSAYKGLAVTAIASSAFSGCTDITSITIPSGVTSIGANAFSGCNGIRTIIIPSNIISIGANAFANCNNLVAVYMPSTVAQLNDLVFSSCISLEAIIVPNDTQVYNTYRDMFISQGLKDKVVCDTGGLSFVLQEDGTYVVSQGETELTGEIIIPAYYNGIAVTAIADGAFEDCTGITSIIMSNMITNIGASAFSGCSSLESVVMSQNVTVIMQYTFAGCSSLTYVELPYGVTDIEAYAFAGCGIEDVIIPSSVVYVYEYAFVDCDNLGVVALARTAGQGITLIHPTAFEDNGLICFVVFDEDSYYDYYDYFEQELSGLEDYLQYVMYFA